MAIKDDIDSIKEELNTQEQFLENIIKSERLFKKYKKIIIGAVVLGVIGAAGYYINGALKEKEFKAANAAYAKLILNPKDEQAKAELKQKDASLYALYEFKKVPLNSQLQSIVKNLEHYQGNAK